MFNNKKDEVISMENTKDKKMEMFRQHCESVVDTFCPIIFVDEHEKFCDENALSTVPQKLIAVNNIGETYVNDLSKLSYETLYAYDDSVNLAVNSLIYRIKEESLMSTMSFMDTIEPMFDNIFMRYFNIREYVDDALRNNYGGVDSAVWSFINARPYSLNKMNDDQVQTTHKIVDFYSRHITAAVIYTIIEAFDKGLDDVLFRIHLIPNIIELKRSIIKHYNVPDEDQRDDKFWILANTTIKNDINNLFTTMLFPILMENIKNIMSTAVGMSYYIYTDAIDEKRKTEGDKKPIKF